MYIKDTDRQLVLEAREEITFQKAYAVFFYCKH